MVVTDRDLRPVWSAQTQLNPGIPSVDVHFGIRRLEEDIVVRKEPGVAIIPAAKFRVASLDVAEIGLRQLHGYVVIVDIPERVTIDGKERVFAHSSLDVQILYAAVNL